MLTTSGAVKRAFRVFAAGLAKGAWTINLDAAQLGAVLAQFDMSELPYVASRWGNEAQNSWSCAASEPVSEGSVVVASPRCQRRTSSCSRASRMN